MRAQATITVLMLAAAAGCGEPFTFTGSGGASSSSTGGATAASTGATSTGATSTASTTGSSSTGGGGCTWNGSTCNSDEYCDACMGGKCVPIPTSPVTSEAAPVCGCDGVTYWNTSILDSKGMALRHPNACTGKEAKLCVTNSACPDGSVCDHQVTNTAGVCGVGFAACVVVPDSCSDTGPKGIGCMPGDSCTKACSLIKADKPWTTTTSCQ